MLECYRIDQKICYQKHMALAMLVLVIVVVTLGAVHYFLFENNPRINAHKRLRDTDSSAAESSAHFREVRSFLELGKSYKIVPDDLIKKERRSAIQSESASFYTIYSADSLFRAMGDPLTGKYYEITPPPPLSAPRLRLDQSRPPTVRTRIDPFGIRNTITIVIMIDSLGVMVPFVDSESNSYEKIPYALIKGTTSDAERVYASLQVWTFASAWDEHGRPVAARFKITHTPRGR